MACEVLVHVAAYSIGYRGAYTPGGGGDFCIYHGCINKGTSVLVYKGLILGHFVVLLVYVAGMGGGEYFCIS